MSGAIERVRATSSHALLVALGLLHVACASNDASTELAIDLRTDLIPAVEFNTALVILGDGQASEIDVERSDDLRMGIRVAEFLLDRPGRLTVEVRLLDAERRFVVNRVSLIELKPGVTAITTVISRECVGVACGEDLTCVASRCVPRACVNTDDEACGQRECVTSGECAALVSCAEPVCVDGTCLTVPLAARCDVDEYCDPDTGCTNVPANSSGCTDDAGCNDGIECTADTCLGGICRHTPAHESCDQDPDGVCDPIRGCVYPECSCAPGEMCCAGACVPAGCDDDNPCTDDFCGAERCEHASNNADCDDAVFCNGADSCADGTCSVHAGSPCAAPTVCDENACVGCVNDEDCPATLIQPWGSCQASGVCEEAGTQVRGLTTFQCQAGTCAPLTEMEERSCARVTEEIVCGASSAGDWGPCTGFTGACDDSGMQERTRTELACESGACTPEEWTEARSCNRSVEGCSCGDGTVYPGEVCDDGNTASNDGCDGGCRPESGWSCNLASPTVCGPVCGDGQVVGSEVCDGNTDIRTVSCGNCGTRAQQRDCSGTCTWSSWTNVGQCTGQGACAPGLTQSRTVACGNCGSKTQTRTCTQACGWGAWADSGGCAGQGACSPGATTGFSESCNQSGGGTRTCRARCNAQCTWFTEFCGSCQ